MNKDVLVIGGGAAGLMCATQAARRGRKVLLIEHAKKVGKKILISGGGRCNFTNLGAKPENYISQNEHFCKSALARYPASEFIRLIESYKISYHEKKLGQLFCDGSAREVVNMLLAECKKYEVEVKTNCAVVEIAKDASGYLVKTQAYEFRAPSLVIATGGLFIPKMGASNFGHRIAKQFGLSITDTHPALVPLTFSSEFLQHFRDLSGISLDAEVSCNGVSFRENILITHKGVSGPAILQISSYWRPGDAIEINFFPELSLQKFIERHSGSSREIKTHLSELLPKRFVERVFSTWLQSKTVKSLTSAEIEKNNSFFSSLGIVPFRY